MAKQKIIPFTAREIVTYKKTNPFSTIIDNMPNPDKVLELNGGRVDGELLDIYDRILRKDAHLYSLFQTRKHLILSKPFEILPAGEDEKDIEICDFVKHQINDRITNFSQDLYELLKAFDYGFSVAEYLFVVENGRLLIDKIKFKHPNNFAFDTNNELVLHTNEKKEKLPQDKFIIHRHNYSDQNPYGESLISERLYWLYYFKQNILSFLVSFIERFGSPVPILKYPPGTSREELDKLDDIIFNFHNELGMKVPEGVVAQLLEWKTSGNRSTHENAIDLINSEMSKAVLGQTLTSETKDTGSRAQAQVHLDVLENIVRFDCQSLAASINDQLIRRLVFWNFTTDRYPRMKFKTEPEKDLKALAERDEILVRMGVRLPDSYFAEAYNIPVEEVDKEKDKIAEGKKEPVEDEDKKEEETEEFAEKDIDEDELVIRQNKELDRYIDKALENAITLQEKFNNRLKTIIKEKTSINELKAIDKEIYRDDIEPLAEALSNITFWTYLLGRSHVLEQYESIEFAEQEDFPFTQAVNFFKDKVPMTHDEFQSIYDKLYDKSFYIARVNDKRLVDKVHGEFVNSLEKGTTLYEFRKNINTYFDRAGVSRLNPHHLETVFRTNLAGAYGEGRRQQMLDPDTRDTFPYWRYSAVVDRRTRSSHRKLHGLILPSNHARWSSIYPPSGFRCRCTVVPVSRGYFKRKGIPEPKKGELKFVYHNKDVGIKGSTRTGDRGKGGWNIETIKENSFVFPQTDFKKQKDFFKIDKKIHGDPGDFAVKNRVRKPYPTKIIDKEELPAPKTNADWKAIVSEKAGSYGFEEKVYKGVNVRLQKRKVRDFEHKDIKAFIKKTGKTKPHYLNNLRQLTYVAETIKTYERGREWHNYGWYDRDNKEIYLFNRGTAIEKQSVDYVLSHELGHHVYYELLDKEFGKKIQAVPNGNEKIVDVIIDFMKGNKDSAEDRLRYYFKFDEEEVRRIGQIL